MKKRKKYALFPGYVQSRTDGEWHYIDAPKLAKLYHVKLSECEIFLANDNKPRSFADGLIKLFPRYDENYDRQQ